MRRIFFVIIFIVIFISIYESNPQTNHHPKKSDEQYDVPLRYEDIKDSYFMRKWRQSKSYQELYTYISEQAKNMWPHDYERRQKEIKNYMYNYEEKFFDDINKKKSNSISE